MTHYTKRIRDLREDSDLKQSEVAAALHIVTQQYQRYESGMFPLPIDKLIELCIFYDTDPAYILGFTDKKARLPK